MILFLSTFTLQAHPHIFIDGSIQFVSNAKGIEGIRMVWVWDENWSNDIINDCDEDCDGVFSKKETAVVLKDFMTDLRDLNYFTEIYIDGKKQKIANPIRFSASINDDCIVTFDFVFPLAIKPAKSTAVKIYFNDKTTYTAFEEKVNLLKSPGYNYEKTSVSLYKDYGVQVSFNLISEK